MKRIVGAGVIALVGLSGYALADSNFQMMVKIDGLSSITSKPSELRTCSEIQASPENVGSGIYTINPSGDSPLSVFCDMDTDGGGWTMIQYREHDKSFLFTSDLGKHFSDTHKPYSYTLPDGEYLSLRGLSTQLMYEQLPASEKGIVSLYKAMNTASCTKLGGTLATFVLVHDETEGCSGTGIDYSNIGYRNPSYPPNDLSTSLVNESSFFDKVFGDVPAAPENRYQGVLFLR